MAGARKVYAIEATSMSQHARRLVQQNGMQDVVVVLEGYMEKTELPEKVDVIISEWMGYFLLREAMFDSVLAARDSWLKPGGAMFPSHASLRMAPLCSHLYASRVAEYTEEIGAWEGFGEWMAKGNGINVAGLTEFFHREQHEYLLQSAQWCQLRQSEVIGDEFAVVEFDVGTTTVDELKAVTATFRTVLSEDAELNAFGGWFDTDFRGSTAQPAAQPVTLTTSPESNTHWAQQVFMVHPPIPVQVGDTLEGTVKLARQRLNHRLMWVQLTLTLNRDGIGQVGPERTLNFRID
jgi:protein arginine N-methyltransferase 1